MSYGVKLHVWGDYACFTRPEMKVERVSYDAMTPSAARGILEAVHWKPAIRWIVDRIHVLKPIRFENLRRNELGHKIRAANVRRAINAGDVGSLPTLVEVDRQQRATTLLRDVAYVIEAHFVLTDAAQPDDTEAKHLSMFNRRATKGQCFHRPYLGTREFPADFELITDQMPPSLLPQDQRNRDLGWMLHDLDYARGMAPRFFHVVMMNGAIEVPAPESDEVKG